MIEIEGVIAISPTQQTKKLAGTSVLQYTTLIVLIFILMPGESWHLNIKFVNE